MRVARSCWSSMVQELGFAKSMDLYLHLPNSGESLRWLLQSQIVQVPIGTASPADVAVVRPRRSLGTIPDWNPRVGFGMVPRQRTASCGHRAEWKARRHA